MGTGVLSDLGHDVTGLYRSWQYLQMRCFNDQNYYCECGHLKTVGRNHLWKVLYSFTSAFLFFFFTNGRGATAKWFTNCVFD